MSKPRITFLSDSEIEAIHDASLRVLQKTGIKVMSETALDILKKAGARVDYQTGHVTIPRGLVEEALEMAPRTITYGARNPEHDFLLNKQKAHFCVSGMPPFVSDMETGKRRSSTKEDLASFSIVADYLGNVDVIWPAVVTTEVPPPMQCLTEFITVAINSTKHLEHEALNARDAQYQIEIAAAIVGGREVLKRRPIISAVACTISPLTYDKGITEGAIEYARAGIPVAIMPMPTVGGTGPATVAGTMVVNNAEFLGGLVIQEFASPGAPVVYSAGPGTMDFKTGANIRTPERSLMHLGLSQVARYYGLPSEIGITGGTDAKILDAQAGYERVMTILTHLLTVPDIALGLGGLNRALLMSLEALVIDNEIIDYALRFIEGIEVNEETLAVDIIDKVGPGGVFLGEKHTVQHFREVWVPRLSDISSYETWEKRGSKTIDEVAREKVREILATHRVTPLSEDVEREIGRILKRAEAELV